MSNDPYSEHLPDDPTLPKVCCSQVKLQLDEKVFANVDRVLQARGLPE